MKLEFSQQTFKNIQKQNLMKIRPVRAELFQVDGHTDRQTYIRKLIVVFLQFCKRP
jgi:hypothetical protein